MKALELFERMVFSAKRLVLDFDLSDEEAKEISAATDKVNAIRDKYTKRKLEGVSHRDNEEGIIDNDLRIHE
jgi:hypothetical protein